MTREDVGSTLRDFGKLDLNKMPIREQLEVLTIMTDFAERVKPYVDKYVTPQPKVNPDIVRTILSGVFEGVEKFKQSKESEYAEGGLLTGEPTSEFES